MPVRRRAYRLAGLWLTVESSLLVVIEYLDLLFGAFETKIIPVADATTYSIEAVGSAFVVSSPDTEDLAFATEIGAAEYVQWHMSQVALRRVSDRFALHAAGLLPSVPDAGAILVLGPSGAGKSTLAAGLIQRGFGFMSDEAVLLSFSDGTVTGFPRALGLIEQRDTDHCVRKRYTSVSDLGVPVASGPAAVDMIVLLANRAEPAFIRHVCATQALPRLIPQVFATTPVEPILAALIRLCSTSRVVELRAGTPIDGADLVAGLLTSVRAA
jgi:hypothetical protein